MGGHVPSTRRPWAAWSRAWRGRLARLRARAPGSSPDRGHTARPAAELDARRRRGPAIELGPARPGSPSVEPARRRRWAPCPPPGRCRCAEVGARPADQRSRTSTVSCPSGGPRSRRRPRRARPCSASDRPAALRPRWPRTCRSGTSLRPVEGTGEDAHAAALEIDRRTALMGSSWPLRSRTRPGGCALPGDRGDGEWLRNALDADRPRHVGRGRARFGQRLLRGQDLAALCQRRHPRCNVDADAAVVVALSIGDRAVQTDPDGQGEAARSPVLDQRLLDGNRTGDGRSRGPKGNEEPVAGGVDDGPRCSVIRARIASSCQRRRSDQRHRRPPLPAGWRPRCR